MLAGGKPKGEHVVQECAVGLVQIRREGTRLSFAAPPLRRSGPLAEDDLQLIAHGLGIARSDILDHAWCDNGPGWRAVMLGSAEQVLSLKPDAEVLRGLEIGVVGPRGKVGVVGAHAEGDELFEVRAFFPGNQALTEDPVTGSLNAALGQWLIGAGLAPDNYIARQGTALGRAGRVHVSQDMQGQVWVGGDSVACVHGHVLI